MDEFSGRGDQVPPELELELMDLSVRAAAVDEQATMDDPETHPKPPRAADEPVTDAAGDPVDVVPAASVGVGPVGLGLDEEQLLGDD